MYNSIADYAEADNRVLKHHVTFPGDKSSNDEISKHNLFV